MGEVAILLGYLPAGLVALCLANRFAGLGFFDRGDFYVKLALWPAIALAAVFIAGRIALAASTGKGG